MHCAAIERISKDGFKKARAITRHHAKSFYFASRFLPRAKQNAAYAVYAICRISDDSVDIPKTGDNKKNLAAIKERIDCAYADAACEDALTLAFTRTINEYTIPKTYFDELIRGMEMDLEKKRYATFDELYTYCYRVAGVIGLIMLKIFGAQKTEAEQHAIELGIAMQLTNILRDIREDYERGRIYLPQDEMAQYNISEDDIKNHTTSEQFAAFLQSQINRAQRYYKNSSAGIPLITDRRCRLVAGLMKNIYAALLDEIKKNKYDVYRRRTTVPQSAKIAIALKTIACGKK